MTLSVPPASLAASTSACDTRAETLHRFRAGDQATPGLCRNAVTRNLTAQEFRGRMDLLTLLLDTLFDSGLCVPDAIANRRIDLVTNAAHGAVEALPRCSVRTGRIAREIPAQLRCLIDRGGGETV